MDLTMLFTTIQETHQAIFPVVTSQGQLIGMIYLEDLPEILPIYTSQPETLVDQVMEPVRYTVNSSNSVEEVMVLFEKSELNYLPVIDNDQLVGYYSKARLLEAYRKKIMDSLVE